MRLCWKVRGGGWNLYDVGKAVIYDMNSGISVQVEVTDGIIQVSQADMAAAE